MTSIQLTSGPAPAAMPLHRAGHFLIRGTLLGAALAAGLIGFLPGSASAQESGDETEANVAVLGGITMTGLTESFTLTGTPGQTVTEDGVVTFNVETNNVGGYGVTVQSQDATMLPANTVTNTDSIEIADLTVRETGDTAFLPLSSTAPVSVHTQTVRSADGGDELSNDYEIRVPVVNVDTYSATLDYVASTL